MTPTTDCPYCSLADKRGQLYCSLHQTEMATLRSGIFFIHGRRFEQCDDHLTRLSLNFNLDESQAYTVGMRKHHVSPRQYLLIDEGQSFRTACNSDHPGRMLTVAYQVGLAQRMYYALCTSHDTSLDTPEGHAELHLFDQTQPMTPQVTSIASRLAVDNHQLNDVDFHEILEDLLEVVLMGQQGVQRRMASIDKVKRSTRQEIYRRLQWTIEYIDANFTRKVTVEELAGEACLSPFHFKRLFRQVFQQPPYQYIKMKRIQRAKELLARGYAVHEVCNLVGWEDASSFIRLFKKVHSITPGKFKTAVASGER